MAQYIDKDALVVEIKRRRDLHFKNYAEKGFESSEGKYDEDKHILSFINTLEVKEVDLEEAGRNYADNEEYGDDVYLAIKAAFKAGAKWQSKKEQDIIETAEDHAFLAGANWQKEQMMKDAVDADAVFDYYDNQNRLYVSILATDVLAKKYSLKDRDKVKIIIIKEEENERI